MYTRTDTRGAMTIVLILVKSDRFAMLLKTTGMSSGGGVQYLGLVAQAASDPILSVPDTYSTYILS